jgi:hypothetical protein
MSFILSAGVVIPPLTAGALVYGNGSNVLLNAQGTAGQVLTSAGAGTPVWTTITGGTTYTTKTSNYTAINGDNLFCDTSAGAFTITLPSSPSINNYVYLQDAKGTFATNALTIAPGSNSIMGQSGNLIATLNNAGFGLFFNGTEWRIL